MKPAQTHWVSKPTSPNHVPLIRPVNRSTGSLASLEQDCCPAGRAGTRGALMKEQVYSGMGDRLVQQDIEKSRTTTEHQWYAGRAWNSWHVWWTVHRRLIFFSLLPSFLFVAMAPTFLPSTRIRTRSIPEVDTGIDNTSSERIKSVT